MKTGLVIPRKSFTQKAQVEKLIAQGVPERRIYVAGERGETPEAAYKASRDKLVHCADGLRTFGTSQKAIRAALVDCEKRGIVIVDAERGWRSDKNPWEMFDFAVGKGAAEERGLNPKASREGGHRRASRLEDDRLPLEKFMKMWFNLKRFDTDQKVCDEANKLHPPKIEGHQGWTPQTARRHPDIGSSGRPRGNRAFKLKKD